MILYDINSHIFSFVFRYKEEILIKDAIQDNLPTLPTATSNTPGRTTIKPPPDPRTTPTTTKAPTVQTPPPQVPDNLPSDDLDNNDSGLGIPADIPPPAATDNLPTQPILPTLPTPSPLPAADSPPQTISTISPTTTASPESKGPITTTITQTYAVSVLMHNVATTDWVYEPHEEVVTNGGSRVVRRMGLDGWEWVVVGVGVAVGLGQ